MIKAKDSSVRDHTQWVRILGTETIEVTSKVGPRKAGSYQFPVQEWAHVERTHQPNPAWWKREFIGRLTADLDDQPGGPDQAERIRDSQIRAIDKAYAQLTAAIAAEKQETGMAAKRAPRVVRNDVSPFASAFAASDAAGEKRPLFEPGTYVMNFRGLEIPEPVPGKHEWCIANFDSEDSDERSALFCMSSKSLSSSLPRLKSLLMALINCPTLEEYNAFDPEGKFFSAFLGYENDMSELAEQYTGSKVKVIASKGGAVKDKEGEFHVNVSFTAVEAEEQAAE